MLATGQETDLNRFLASLTHAWREGEDRPLRHWRTRQDPFEVVWPEVCQWLANDLTQTGRALFERLQHNFRMSFRAGSSAHYSVESKRGVAIWSIVWSLVSTKNQHAMPSALERRYRATWIMNTLVTMSMKQPGNIER